MSNKIVKQKSITLNLIANGIKNINDGFVPVNYFSICLQSVRSGWNW